MASAVASSLLVPAAAAASSSSPATACVWLGPRVSFSGRDAAAIAAEEEEETPVASASPVATPAISKDFIDFEFSSFGGCAASMLPADELFADGKLLPLRKADAAAAAAPEPEAPRPARSEAMPAEQTMKPLRAAAGAAAADQYVFSPKAPSCSSRWRELLGLKRASSSASQSPRPSRSPSALAKTPGRTTTAAGSSSAARSLKFLLQRSNHNSSSSSGGRASSDLASAPLLRDSSDSEASLSLASSRFSLSSSSSSSGGHDHDDIVINPRFSLDSGADLSHPPRLRLVRSSGRRHSTSAPARRGPSPPPPPRCISVDSPRMNSSGKIVFQQSPLERSCSSPCSFHHAASKSRSSRAAVDRSFSYSSGGVRVAPVVLNVPVCSRPVFGFFKDKQKDSSAAANSKVDSTASARTSRTSSTLGRKAAPPPPQRWSGELPKLCSG